MSVSDYCNTLPHISTTLQHPSTHCNTLQYTATHCRCSSGYSHVWHDSYICQMIRTHVAWLVDMWHDSFTCICKYQVLQHVAVCCSVLLCVAVCCSVLRCHLHVFASIKRCSGSYRVAKTHMDTKSCSVLLQCVAICCSAWRMRYLAGLFLKISCYV